MATPSGKPGATPTHLTSSPHPSSAPLSRSVAHKSPSMRTPTASNPGPTQLPNTSSHQCATPLNAPTAVDPNDPVSFSSPSALLALGGYAGISPSPAVHENLVGPGMNENDIQNLGMQGMKLGVTRDSDVEQRQRIEEVVRLLATRVTGRGVSREGIERLSNLQGFESLWQNDNINIAGNFVDLEIEFHAGYDVVKDVSLRYATPEYEEGERREAATLVLKRNLVQSPEDADAGRWRKPDNFYENLQWLAKLDKLSQEVNCFEALEGLEEGFKRIWAEEEKNGKYGGENQHLCTSVIGRPTMHRGYRIGLGLDYWAEQPKLLDVQAAKAAAASADAMAIDQPQNSDADTKDLDKLWTMLIECEEGYPSLRISKEWVGGEVFTAGENSKAMPSAGSAGSANWLDPPQTMRLSHGNHPDPMALDSSMLEQSPPNRRFVAKLEPALDVPILAASEIYRHFGMQLPQDFKMVTYDGMLVPGSATDSSAQPGRRNHNGSVLAVDSHGVSSMKEHRYSFQAFESVAGRTIRDLPFSHPRQVAEILPVLRQYALLASLIRRVFKTPAPVKKEAEKPTEALSSRPDSPDENLTFLSKTGITILSNEDPNKDNLEDLMSGKGHGSRANSMVSDQQDDEAASQSTDNSQSVMVDITLRTQLGQAPAIILYFTDLSRTTGNLSPTTICFEVGLNGRVTVANSSGLVEDKEDDSGDSKMQEADDSELQAIHKKIAKVMEVSQDIGITVEWVLRWQRGRDGSG
ncbi:hypothetical protein N7532_011806 [Penicillium argentinense]|uniref:Mediator of RNA polymerase II transcription subunit 1 n=1 Tax=Penicillium argentinense TaxID=1131581 RepID=A0A9W9EJ61_9EURO|nr:uncharacterized protein N7532_011806 [Penicillium argentinense]KAJ5082763.1 hypothetical protein N7532_011806 [Penicillium argentinense]